jgi:hypothetical protein
MIKGFNISTWHHPGTAKAWIKEASQMGANTIRYQITPSNLLVLQHRQSYLDFINESIDDLLEIINYSEANRIPVKYIIDLHAPFRGLNEKGQHYCLTDRETRKLWREDLRLLADVFEPFDSVKALEFINEPHTFSNKRWARQAKVEVSRIRKYWKKQIVVPCHNIGPKEIEDLEPLRRKKILYTAHMYSPFEITHAGIYKPIDLPFPALKLKKRLSELLAWKQKHRKPLFVGEFGCVDLAGADMQRRYISRCAKIFNRNRIGWCLYPWKDRHIWNYESSGVIKEIKKYF